MDLWIAVDFTGGCQHHPGTVLRRPLEDMPGSVASHVQGLERQFDVVDGACWGCEVEYAVETTGFWNSLYEVRFQKRKVGPIADAVEIFGVSRHKVVQGHYVVPVPD